MHIRGDEALRRLAAGPLVGLGGALFAQQVDGLLDVTARFLECLLAVHHAGARPGAELRHQLRGNLFHSRHLRLLLAKKAALTPWGREGGGQVVTRVRGAGGPGQPSVPAGASPAAGASSVLSRAAIASGLGRRLRRAGFFFRSPATSASTPVSVE